MYLKLYAVRRRVIIILLNIKDGTFYENNPPRWNPLWLGEGAYLTKRFHLVRQQGELAGSTQLRSIETNRSSLCLCQGLDLKQKNIE